MEVALIATSNYRVVVGMGQTGMSCARYLADRGLPFSLVDTRLNPPNLSEAKKVLPEDAIKLGDLDLDLLCQADEIILSPGLSLQEPAIKAAKDAGVSIIGDIDLFRREMPEVPLVAITGSNGKSTVTSLVGEMARAAGLRSAVAGNIGVPVLDLLDGPERDSYVFELSSFQLETCEELNPSVSVVLNVSADHMDRYPNVMALSSR